MRHRQHRAHQRLRNDGTVAFAESLREQPRPLPELCRRHVPVAWRTAMAITSDPAEASEAVAQAFTEVMAGASEDPGVASSLLRPQLLAATREVAVSALRRSGGGPQPGSSRDLAPPAAGAAIEPAEPDDGLPLRVASAFRSLPERWRSVLWLVEVERIPAPEAARIIGVNPTEISALTARAWAGLRELSLAERQPDAAGATTSSGPDAWTSSPVSPGKRPACRPTVDRLAGYLGGALSPAQRAEVEAHLEGCDTCQAHLDQLQELATTLRQVVVPLPEGLLNAATWEVGEHSGRRLASALPAEVSRPLVRAWLAALGLAIIGVAVLDQASAPLVPATSAPGSTVSSNAPTVIVVRSSPATAPQTGLNLGSPGTDSVGSPDAGPNPPASSSQGTSTTSGSSAPSQPSGTGPTGQGAGSPTPVGDGAAAAASGSAGSSLLVLPSNVLPSVPLSTITQQAGSLLPQVALDTGLAGIPVALNLGPCTGLQLAFLALGCTSPSLAYG